MSFPEAWRPALHTDQMRTTALFAHSCSSFNTPVQAVWEVSVLPVQILSWQEHCQAPVLAAARGMLVPGTFGGQLRCDTSNQPSSPCPHPVLWDSSPPAELSRVGRGQSSSEQRFSPSSEPHRNPASLREAQVSYWDWHKFWEHGRRPWTADPLQPALAWNGSKSPAHTRSQGIEVDRSQRARTALQHPGIYCFNLSMQLYKTSNLSCLLLNSLS